MTDDAATPTHVQLLECNLDDMTGEALGYVLERLLDSGALDAWYTPIYAKKNRPAVMLSVLCRPEDGEALGKLILAETTTLGLRTRAVERIICDRVSIAVTTPWGEVRCKIKRLEGRVLSIKPEFEDCACIARQHQVPLMQVEDETRRAAWDVIGKERSS